MPEWFDPVLNTSVATGIIGFACWGLARISRFLGPLLSAFFEGHAGLIDSLKQNNAAQTSLLERTTQMQDAHGKKLESVAVVVERTAERVETHERILGEIRDRVIVKGCTPTPDPKVQT